MNTDEHGLHVPRALLSVCIQVDPWPSPLAFLPFVFFVPWWSFRLSAGRKEQCGDWTRPRFGSRFDFLRILAGALDMASTGHKTQCGHSVAVGAGWR